MNTLNNGQSISCNMRNLSIVFVRLFDRSFVHSLLMVQLRRTDEDADIDAKGENRQSIESFVCAELPICYNLCGINNYNCEVN